ncbi:uncharacterized protein LOC141690943 [Apium graveolens]|uniref:uncharacterized protein LOC141690943 n=1 Tax=Apium graveolens TaxID=4045 RepID=UPI003D7BBF20
MVDRLSDQDLFMIRFIDKLKEPIHGKCIKQILEVLCQVYALSTLHKHQSELFCNFQHYTKAGSTCLYSIETFVFPGPIKCCCTRRFIQPHGPLSWFNSWILVFISLIELHFCELCEILRDANVYHATRSDGQELAIKVYKTSVLVFKDRDRYVQGDYRFRYGYRRHNPRKMVKTWAEKEMRNLMRYGGKLFSSVSNEVRYRYNSVILHYRKSFIQKNAQRYICLLSAYGTRGYMSFTKEWEDAEE